MSPGSGICERGSEDGVLARVSPENIPSCQCHFMMNSLQRKIFMRIRCSNIVSCCCFFCDQVLMFAEKKADVDAIHEYLLLKGVEAVAIHGGKGKRLKTA